MRIVVTGVAGFVGSHLAEALLGRRPRGRRPRCVHRLLPRPVKERNLAGLIARPDFTFHERDLRTDPLEPLLEGADAVVHLAAMPGLARSWTDVELYTTCNLLATHRLVEAILATGVPRLLHASTSSVYGTDAVGDETAPTQPVSPYGVTKLAAEHLVLAYVRSRGLDASILRYFSMFGPRQRPDMGYHIFIEALLDGRPITVFGDGEQSRSNTYISDCVRGTVAAIEGAATGEIYNIAGGEELTLNEAIRAIADARRRRAADRPRAAATRRPAADVRRHVQGAGGVRIRADRRRGRGTQGPGRLAGRAARRTSAA